MGPGSYRFSTLTHFTIGSCGMVPVQRAVPAVAHGHLHTQAEYQATPVSVTLHPGLSDHVSVRIPPPARVSLKRSRWLGEGGQRLLGITTPRVLLAFGGVRTHYEGI